MRFEAVHCDRLRLPSDVDDEVLGPPAYHSVRTAVGRCQGAGLPPLPHVHHLCRGYVRGRPGFGEGYEIKLDKLVS